jgi:tight adherence protein B
MPNKEIKKSGDLLFSSFFNRKNKTKKDSDENNSTHQSLAELFNLQINPVLFIVLLVLGAVILFWAFMSMFNGIIMGLLGALGGIVVFNMILGSKKKQKEGQFTRQLPATLTAIANSLKAGFSLDQAFEFVTVSLPDPTKSEFSVIHLKYRVGYTLAESMAELPQKYNNAEVNLFVSSLVLQNQVGGNVIPFLGELSEILRERVKLKEQIAVGTTQQRMSSMIVAILPYIMLMLLQMSHYNALTTTLSGILLLLFAMLMQGLGMFVTSTFMKIDI